jgi:hypothetical protein
MKKYIGLYIGPNKIKKVEKSKRATYLDNEILSIEYDGGKKEERPKEIVDKIAFKDSYDLTELRERIGKIVVEKIVAILLEAEVNIVDIDYILQLTANSINHNLEKATEVLWNKSLLERTIADVHLTLKKEKKNAK